MPEVIIAVTMQIVTTIMGGTDDKQKI